MNQKAKDMSFDELLNAMKIKLKESTEVVKPKPEFPIVFKDDYDRRIEVGKSGFTSISDEQNTINFAPGISLPLLYKAVEKSKQLRG